MKLKDKLIRKLLDAGKRHRILVYPTLALIAVISAISHMVYWGRGNGKKVVASIMVMVMLITQSLFLTSSAGVSDDTPTAPGVATDTDAPSDINDPVANRTINYHRVDSDNEIHTVHTGLSVQPVYGTDGAVVNYKLILPSDEVLAGWCFGTEHTYQKDHVTFSDMYLDPNCTIPVGDSGVITADWDSYIENNCYNVYFSATRNTYPVTIIDNDGGNPAVITAIAANETTGDIYPSASYTVLTAADYNMYRIGFTYFGLEYGGEAFIAGQDINIDPSDEMPVSALYLSVKWTAMKFPVTFDAIGDNTPSSVVLDNGASEEITREYTYGSTQMLPTPNEIWASSDAYILSGWSYGDEVFSVSENVNTSQLVERATDDLTENPNIVAKKLTAIWSYKNIKLTATNDGVVDPETNAITITGTYGDSVSSKFGALYLDGTQSEFTFSLSTEDVTKLGQYGLGILGGEGYFTIKGQLSDITPEGGISVKLLVKDSKIDDNPDTAIDESVSE
ncbi:MAG: hypothetical protein IJX12_07065, partial [Lachnospiraceae bacterium]|nr:hypothetical protein [Lachnospiraceae bacterium]